jgi:predicted nucleic-acid-binding protein
MRAADTNVIVRIFARDDERQVIVADAFVENGAWVSHLVLVEAVWVLGSTYGLDHTEIATMIEMLLSHRSLIVQDAEVVEAALDQYRRRPSLEFFDCLLLELARKAGHLPLGTFDRNLSRLPGTERL